MMVYTLVMEDAPNCGCHAVGPFASIELATRWAEQLRQAHPELRVRAVVPVFAPEGYPGEPAPA